MESFIRKSWNLYIHQASLLEGINSKSYIYIAVSQNIDSKLQIYLEIKSWYFCHHEFSEVIQIRMGEEATSFNLTLELNHGYREEIWNQVEQVRYSSMCLIHLYNDAKLRTVSFHQHHIWNR